MKTENLIEKAIAKATGRSENEVLTSTYMPISLKEAKEAIQYAIDERTNDILHKLRTFLEQDMTAPKDQKHKYGFESAIDMINDNFFE